MLMFFLALALAAPTAFSEIHQRDISCVATFAILADEQRRGVALDTAIPDVREDGKKWTVIVGERVMQETGQPRELVGVAMTEAAKAEQGRAAQQADPAAFMQGRISACLPLMRADLLANQPLPKPVKAQ